MSESHDPIPAPDPGVYENVPDDLYHRWSCVSKHQLDNLLQSPAHLDWHRRNRSEPTPAMALGSAFHSLVLDGKKSFTEKYLVAEQCQSIKASGESCKNGVEWINEALAEMK